MTDDELRTLLDRLSLLIEMPIPEEFTEGVLRQLETNRLMAEPLLRFDLPADCAPAPVFRP